MKKVFLTLILLAAILTPFVMLTSCSDNEDDVEYKLLSKQWHYIILQTLVSN